MARLWQRSVYGRRWLAAFVAVALAVQILVPQGFMLAPDAGGATTLYICGGHGPVGGLDHGNPAKAPKSNDGGICGFAAHNVAATTPSLAQPVAMPFYAAATPSRKAFEAAPGLGLAAPPPPSQAPPYRLI